MYVNQFMNPSVLLVDDEEAFVQATAKRMTKRSLDVDQAYSGEEALAKLAACDGKPYDVVVLDVKMPGMDGLETLRRIRKEFPGIEVVMLTGHATVDDAIEGMKMGAFDYLMKPCEVDHLVAKVQEATARKRNRDAKMLEERVASLALQRGLD